MNTKMYFLISGVLFTIIALLQLTRFLFGWEAMIGGWSVPLWISGVFVIIAGYLAYTGFRLRKTVL